MKPIIVTYSNVSYCVDGPINWYYHRWDRYAFFTDSKTDKYEVIYESEIKLIARPKK